jgi:D-3-phosphoglycerate dehydrogenase
MASGSRGIAVPQKSDSSRQVSSSLGLGLSTSPIATFHSPPSSHGAAMRTFPSGLTKTLKPFATEDIKILLLENVNQTGRDILSQQGYQVEFLKASLPEDQLIEKIRCAIYSLSRSQFTMRNPGRLLTEACQFLIYRDVHVIGIRSKTKLTERVLREARNLIVIGCFCIGTNQVDLRYAADHGIAVFNSPFSNSRSVAELVIAEIIALARQLGDRSNEMHNGVWNKVSSKCWEVRGKTLGGFTLRQHLSPPAEIVLVGLMVWH